MGRARNRFSRKMATSFIPYGCCSVNNWQPLKIVCYKDWARIDHGYMLTCALIDNFIIGMMNNED